MDARGIGVVVAAAGSSRRMAGTDKLWLDVRGQPLLAHTLEALALALPGAQVVGVCSDAGLRRVQPLREQWPWRYVARWVEGGAHRQDSVYAGLCALDACEVVLIHDAARPFVTAAICAAGVEAARACGAATAGVPVTDTIKAVDPATSLVTATPDRSTLWAVQTPQVFAYHVIMRAYAELGPARTNATDDCALVERIGHPVRVFPGSPHNIKISTPADLALLRLFGRDEG